MFHFHSIRIDFSIEPRTNSQRIFEWFEHFPSDWAVSQSCTQRPGCVVFLKVHGIKVVKLRIPKGSSFSVPPPMEKVKSISTDISTNLVRWRFHRVWSRAYLVVCVISIFSFKRWAGKGQFAIDAFDRLMFVPTAVRIRRKGIHTGSHNT